MLNAKSYESRSQGKDMVNHGQAARRNNDNDRGKKSALLGPSSDPRYNTLLDERLGQSLDKQRQYEEDLCLSTVGSDRQHSLVRGLLLRCVVDAVTSGRVTKTEDEMRFEGGQHVAMWADRGKLFNRLSKAAMDHQADLCSVEGRWRGGDQVAVKAWRPGTPQPSIKEYIDKATDAMGEHMDCLEATVKASNIAMKVNTSKRRKTEEADASCTSPWGSKVWYESQDASLKGWKALYHYAKDGVSLKRALHPTSGKMYLASLEKAITELASLDATVLLFGDPTQPKEAANRRRLDALRAYELHSW